MNIFHLITNTHDFKGFIYVIHNKYLCDGIYKIGKTERSPWDRLDELSKPTGVPGKYIMQLVFPVNDPDNEEINLFAFFDEFRVEENQEFFKISLLDIIKYFIDKKISPCYVDMSVLEQYLNYVKNLDVDGKSYASEQETLINAIGKLHDEIYKLNKEHAELKIKNNNLSQENEELSAHRDVLIQYHKYKPESYKSKK